MKYDDRNSVSDMIADEMFDFAEEARAEEKLRNDWCDRIVLFVCVAVIAYFALKGAALL